MKLPTKPRGNAWRTFRWPTLIAFASVVGLLSALLGNGMHDLLSWLCLGALILIAALAWLRGT